jgi:hypothetical protein
MTVRGNATDDRLASGGRNRSQQYRPLNLAVLMAAAAALSACGTATSSAEHSESVSTTMRTSTGMLSIDVEAGSLHFVPGPSGLLSLRGTVTYRGGRPPGISWQGAGRSVSLRSVCHSRDGDCGYSYVVSVPVSTTVVADVYAGDIWAKGLAGTLQLRALAGDVTLTDLSGPLYVTGGSGNITAVGLRSASSNVEEGEGNVSLRFAAAPSHLVAKTGTGDVGVIVPPSFSYHVLTSDQLGNVASGISDDVSSPRVISLSVGTGNIDLNQFQG